MATEKTQLTSSVEKLTTRQNELNALVGDHQDQISALQADKSDLTSKLQGLQGAHGEVSTQVSQVLSPNLALVSISLADRPSCPEAWFCERQAQAIRS